MYLFEMKDENTDDVLLHPGTHRRENVPRKVQFDSVHPDLHLLFFSAVIPLSLSFVVHKVTGIC